MAKCVLWPRRTRGGVFDSEALGRHSAVPSGLIAMPTFPALKRRAILMMSLRDRERSPTGRQASRIVPLRSKKMPKLQREAESLTKQVENLRYSGGAEMGPARFPLLSLALSSS